MHCSAAQNTTTAVPPAHRAQEARLALKSARCAPCAGELSLPWPAHDPHASLLRALLWRRLAVCVADTPRGACMLALLIGFFALLWRL